MVTLKKKGIILFIWIRMVLLGEEPSLKTVKAFILGEAPGIFTGKIKYVDGRVEMLNSFLLHVFLPCRTVITASSLELETSF